MSHTRVSLRSLALLACLAACGNSSSSNNTFPCEGATTVQCQVSDQYCELVTAGGATTATCRAVPASCNTGSSPCSCIAGMSDGSSNSCVSVSIGTARQTTITYSR